MSRLLIERTLHSSVLAAISAQGGERWGAHAVSMIGAELGQERLADLNVVDRAKAYGEAEFPNTSDERIQTRLGEGDRLVRFVPAVKSPFGNAVRELAIQSWLAKGVAGDECDATEVAQEGGVVRFRFGARHFIYDRLGLRSSAKPTGLPMEGHDDDGP